MKKDTQYACMYEEDDGFMYHEIYPTKKMAKRAMKQALKWYSMKDTPTTMRLVNAYITKIKKQCKGD